MNRDDIIKMAREARLHVPYWNDDENPTKDPPRWTKTSPTAPLLERFAALVAAAEREACAQLCEAEAEKWEGDDGPISAEARLCALAIRARGTP